MQVLWGDNYGTACQELSVTFRRLFLIKSPGDRFPSIKMHDRLMEAFRSWFWVVGSWHVRLLSEGRKHYATANRSNKTDQNNEIGAGFRFSCQISFSIWFLVYFLAWTSYFKKRFSLLILFIRRKNRKRSDLKKGYSIITLQYITYKYKKQCSLYVL